MKRTVSYTNAFNHQVTFDIDYGNGIKLTGEDGTIIVDGVEIPASGAAAGTPFVPPVQPPVPLPSSSPAAPTVPEIPSVPTPEGMTLPEHALPLPPGDRPYTSIEDWTLHATPQTRHGHLYAGAHQRRISILEADDLLFRYSKYTELVSDIEQRRYDGTVRVVLPDRSIRTLRTAASVVENGKLVPKLFPVDYYLWDADGSMVRCDQYAQITKELENMVPYAPGALAGAAPAGGDTSVPIEQA